MHMTSLTTLLIVALLLVPESSGLKLLVPVRTRQSRQLPVPDVAIVSGYASVSRFGRNLDSTPIKAFRSNNVRRRSDLEIEERSPVFDLERMREQEELQRKIDEVRRQVLREEKLQKEAIRSMRLNEAEIRVDRAKHLKQEEIPWSDGMRMSEPRVQRMMQLRHIRHQNNLDDELDNDKLGNRPSSTVDLGYVQEIL